MNIKIAVTSLLVFFVCSFSALGQTYKVSGHVADASDTSAMIGVSVSVLSTGDSVVKGGTVTDVYGNYEIPGIPPASYIIKFDYLGYLPAYRKTKVTGSDVQMGIVKLRSSSKELSNTTVEAKQERAVQLGDTSQFNANAYKTHPDATAEDLVAKMPGITSDNTGVKSNGETVQQVLVDGKPFFGNDPTLALRNLPAEVIDKIQVFDKQSDQSSFTGFDDGNSQKTMNMVTKGSKREGVFGKLFAGYGDEQTYTAGGNLNIFHGNSRITLLAMSNNINQQNFSAQDILGVLSGGGGGGRGGGGGGGRGGGSFGGGGGAAQNFLVGQQNGITTTNSFGANYTDNWGKKLKVSGSYFFNGTDNENTTNTTRDYFTNQHYTENDTSSARNYNHRVNLRFEYTMDSANSIIFTPGVSFQQNNSSTWQFAATDTASKLISKSNNFNGANTTGYSSSDNILFQHKFKKQRRTISLNVSTSINQKTGTSSYKSDNHFYSRLSDSTSLDQNSSLSNNGYTVSPSVNYTEPLGKKGQLMFNYSPSYSQSASDKETYNWDAALKEYKDFDSALSNKYNNTYVTQKAGVSYRLGDKKLNLTFGANYQYATLQGIQDFPYNATVNRNFSNVLPNAMLNYRFADGRNLRIVYRTNTVAPSVTQLQEVVDVSNPILLKTGNANLVQDFEHNLMLRYGLTKSKTGHNFFLFMNASYINNYIGNATFQSPIVSTYKGSLMTSPVIISNGGQLIVPININGYSNEKAFITYSIPVKFIKSNLNLNAGMNYTHTPGQVNYQNESSDKYAPSGGFVLGSNISEKIDFTLSYSGNYNIVKNSIQALANSNYYNHTASFKINYILLKNIVLNTNISHNYYTAFSSNSVQDYLLWNAYIGYKLLKKQALEARISAFDLLNQNKSINRSVTETYVENDVTKVLKQYFMFQLTYTIRNFKGQMPEMPNRPEGGMMRGGGMHMHGGDDH